MDLEFLMVPGAPPPPPTAPYSHAVRAGEFLFVTGQLPADPATGRLVDGGITEQTHQVMREPPGRPERGGLEPRRASSSRASTSSTSPTTPR